MNHRRFIEAVAANAADWTTQAKCRGVSPNVFHSDEPEAVAHAKTWCAVCPVAQPCLAEALRLGRSALGVWGGTTLNQRLGLRSRRMARDAIRQAS